MLENHAFKSAMTVADLKRIVAEWPDADIDGNPCEVWISTEEGLSSPVRALWPLNMRSDGNGSETWADILLESC